MNMTFNPPAASTGQVYGQAGWVTANGATSSSATISGGAFVAINSTTSLAAVNGVTAQTQNTGGAGAVNSVLAMGTAGNGSTTTGLNGLKVNLSASGTGAVSAAKGVDVEISRSGTGVTTNAYGVYIGNIRGSTQHSIYASDATAPSYFAGNVGIGTANPLATLDVNGVAKVSASREMASASVNSSTSYTIPDVSRNIRRITLTGNATITLPDATSIDADPAYTLTVRVTQDATGGRSLNWNGNGKTIRWDGGAAPAHSTTANQTTIYQFFHFGTESVWYGSMVWREN